MKVKLKSSIELNGGKRMLATKFYAATKEKGYYSISFDKDHVVLLSNKFIKECKE